MQNQQYQSAATITGGSVESGIHKTPVACRKKIWIDLDNSPHVPFFTPIIEELEKRGYSVFLTGRDCFQVRDLVELAGLQCKIIGYHWGRNTLLKLAGTCARAVQLAKLCRSEKPDLALSHGSRSQILVSILTRIPSMMIDDYEHSRRGVDPDWLMVPEIIPEHTLGIGKHRIFRYPGIKEDVYVPRFKPELGLRHVLGLNESDIVVTVRPPASEAHYHNPESDVLYRELMDFLIARSGVKVVILPRSPKQAVYAREQWKHGFHLGKLMIPDKAVNGLNLIWFSDLVISGGGTMNREAAAMGIPVYSIFRGPMGAVDRYLATEGKLILVESIEDIGRKIVLQQRLRTPRPDGIESATLRAIVDNVIFVMESPTGYGKTNKATLSVNCQIRST